MNISFSPPDITELEINEVVDALKSGWITTGPKTKDFEKKISSFCNVNNVVCLNSQTACSEMALRMLNVGSDDEVITSSYTYTATASVVCHVGARLKLIDIQNNSFEMDYDALANAITDKTKVVIPVDIAGIPCNYDKIFEIVESKKRLFRPSNQIQDAIGRVIVLGDNAHSFGAQYKGKSIASIPDFASFSFHAVKNLTTAEGGALTWKSIVGISDEEIYRQIQLLSLHGQNKDALSKSKLGAWEYDVIGPYYKCNMTDIQASIGIAQLSRYSSLLEKRKKIIEIYDNEFKPFGIEVLNHYTNEYSSSGHLYITHIPKINHNDRCNIINQMSKFGIACNVHYKPLPLLTAYKNLGFKISDYPNSYKYYENEITLPLHTCLMDEQIDYVIEKYKDIINYYKNG